ncbi:cysteine proteinase [Jaminaea rosea]|uniref:Ubiquitin carboxyl-terminal hydrolase n=1 Tax=Jaminaea rosea TaxID=1569628 RepID=A0A316UWH9_9BASI|nr:cysteine proteinase [Jaminaea rosea]PWN27475.1 cysteine proteinase [Jaminaea rosea]
MRWVPLESNPELFTEWATSLGLPASQWAYHDIFGLDPELLSMVPQPVQAVLLLFPVSNAYEEQRQKEDEGVEISQKGTELKKGEMMWWKQTIGNACGTMGLLHSLSNASSVRTSLPSDSPLAKLIDQSAPLPPLERSALLTKSKELARAHTTAGSGGQTAAPQADESVDLHFTCFVRGESGELVELDGRRKGPVIRKEAAKVEKQEDLLSVAASFVKKHYMEMDPEAVQFNLIALGPAQ